jgi:carbamate kinase
MNTIPYSRIRRNQSGAFYSKEEADIIAQEKGYVMKEDSGRGYRRVVASPIPVDVVEKEMILSLIKISMSSYAPAEEEFRYLQRKSS